MTTTKSNANKEPVTMLEVPGKGNFIFGEKVNPLKGEKEQYVKMVVFEMGENRQFTFNFGPDGIRSSMLAGPKEIPEGDQRGAKKKKLPDEVSIHFDAKGGVERIRFPEEHFEVQLCDGYDLYVFAQYFAKVTGPADDPVIRLSKINLVEGRKPVEAGEITEANSGNRYQECMDEVQAKIGYFHSLSPEAAFPDKWKDAPKGSKPRTWFEAMERADDLREIQQVVNVLKPAQD